MSDKPSIDFPEAPASVTYSITSKGGYNILFTVRAESGLDLLDTMDAIEKKLVIKEYKPQVKQGFGKKEVEYLKKPDGTDMICPTCKIGKVKIIRSPKGTFYGCDQSKYNPFTRTSEGCKFFTSQDPTKQQTELTGHDWDDQYTEPQ
jgi:hypothetical protein